VSGRFACSTLVTHTGLEMVTMLQWSPSGTYLFAGAPGRSFYVWETMQWRHRAWEWSGCGYLLGATWSPDGRSIRTSVCLSVYPYVRNRICPAS
jgi:WD40 repeat protein